MKVHEVDVNPALPERIAWLGEIARNVWSAWNPEAGDLFARLDPEAWERLGTTPWRCCAPCRRTPSTPPPTTRASWRWWPASRGASTPTSTSRAGSLATDDDAKDMLVAYFSLEFGLDAGIPLYSGGLGILAGDHLKSASDIGVPLVGVGLLYRSGYFRQQLGPDGGQRERYPATDWSDLPLSDQTGADGDARRRRGAGGGGPGEGGGPPHPGGPRAAAAARRRHPGELATRSGRSPAPSTAATASGASGRRSCSASAASARWPRPGWRRPCST